MLVACEWLLAGPREIVIAGQDSAALVEILHTRFVPHKIALLADSARHASVSPSGPWIASMQPANECALATCAATTLGYRYRFPNRLSSPS
jgi:hypothetical protein